ncbi:hypothetical protein D3C71_1384490 [compost metagenome]
MAIAAGLSGTTKGNRLQNRHVIFYYGSFTDHDTSSVVKHNAAANRGRRVDVHAESDRNLILQIYRQCLPPLQPQPVADTVSLQRMKTFQVQQRR